jgi:hypothetical protein
MITTSGYGPDSYKFAGEKPLNLIDGSGLLALCQQHTTSRPHSQPQQEKTHRLNPRWQSSHHADHSSSTGLNAASLLKLARTHSSAATESSGGYPTS